MCLSSKNSYTRCIDMKKLRYVETEVLCPDAGEKCISWTFCFSLESPDVMFWYSSLYRYWGFQDTVNYFSQCEISTEFLKWKVTVKAHSKQLHFLWKAASTSLMEIKWHAWAYPTLYAVHSNIKKYNKNLWKLKFQSISISAFYFSVNLTFLLKYIKSQILANIYIVFLNLDYSAFDFILSIFQWNEQQ